MKSCLYGVAQDLHINQLFILHHTQLPLLASDLYATLTHCVAGTLRPEHVQWRPHTVACTVVCAAAGYPGKYAAGEWTVLLQ